MGKAGLGKLWLLLFTSLILSDPSSSDWFNSICLPKVFWWRNCSWVDQHLISTVQHSFWLGSSCYAWLCIVNWCYHAHTKRDLSITTRYWLFFSYFGPCGRSLVYPMWMSSLYIGWVSSAIAREHGSCGKSKQVNPSVDIALHNGGAGGKYSIDFRNCLVT